MPLTDNRETRSKNEGGLFISLEGIDGVGKTTQLDLLERAFSSKGSKVVRLREPGGTDLGEQIRTLLLNTSQIEICGTAELLLFEAARAELVHEAILPSLEAGCVVLCDRFFDSTTAYQGYGRNLGASVADTANSLACHGVVPHRTIFLDLEPKSAIKRATTNGADRMENEGDAFRRTVRDGFLSIVGSEPDRVKLVNAAGTVEEVWDRIRDALCDLADLPDYNLIAGVE